MQMAEGEGAAVVVPAPSPSAGAGEAWATLVPHHAGASLPLFSSVVLLGSSAQCGIRLNQPYVSRSHLRLERHPNHQVYLTALSKTNAVYLNGTRLPPNVPTRVLPSRANAEHQLPEEDPAAPIIFLHCANASAAKEMLASGKAAKDWVWTGWTLRMSQADCSATAPGADAPRSRQDGTPGAAEPQMRALLPPFPVGAMRYKETSVRSPPAKRHAADGGMRPRTISGAPDSCVSSRDSATSEPMCDPLALASSESCPMCADRLDAVAPSSGSSAPAGIFSGCHVMIGVRLCREILETIVQREGGTIVRDPRGATHFVLEAMRDPHTHPALKDLPLANWPQLRQQEWISCCSKLASTGRVTNEAERVAALRSCVHPMAPASQVGAPPQTKQRGVAIGSTPSEGIPQPQRERSEGKEMAHEAEDDGSTAAIPATHTRESPRGDESSSPAALVRSEGQEMRVWASYSADDFAGGQAFRRVLANEVRKKAHSSQGRSGPLSAADAEEDAAEDEAAVLPSIAEERNVTHRQIVLDEFTTLAKSYAATARAARRMGRIGDSAREYHYAQVCSTIESELPAYFDASDIRAFGRLHGVGRETIAKIRQIYRTGALRRADVMRSDPKLHARQELMRVWGIGSARADDLIDMGIHSVEQLKARPDLTNEGTRAFLKHFSDVTLPIPRGEVVEHEERVRRVALGLDPRIRVEATGSFRRGEDSCKDVDMLVWYADEAEMERALIARRACEDLVALEHDEDKSTNSAANSGEASRAATQIPSGDDEVRETVLRTNNTFLSSCSSGGGDDQICELRASPRNAQDNYQDLLGRLVPALTRDGYITHSLTKGFGSVVSESSAHQSELEASHDQMGNAVNEMRVGPEHWSSLHTLYMGICRLREGCPHRRIDLKAAHAATLAYSFMFFTGSAQFNRFVSRYANQLNYRIGPHGMYRLPLEESIQRSRTFGGDGPRGNGPAPGTHVILAATEADIFATLGLRYVPPKMRRGKNDVVLVDGSPAFPDSRGPSATPKNAPPSLPLLGSSSPT